MIKRWKTMPRWQKLVMIGPLAIVGFALFIAIGGGLVQWLWNYLLPPLFGWPTLTFWQALALLALCRILFGGWRSSGSGGSNWHRRMKERLTERYESMSEEERERFRQRVRERWGFDPAAAPDKGTSDA